MAGQKAVSEHVSLSTTGAGSFAEGPRLSAKPLRPSAKSLPSAALGKVFAECPTLGKVFAECPTLGKAQNKKNTKKA
jgi:hypothetical protein